jgi:acetyl-CoA acetyltransferase
MNDPIVIVGAARTPMGAFQGDFSSLSASDLGAVAIRAAVERAGVPADQVQDVLFGNCLMAGQGQAPARQAAIKAGIPVSAGAVTMSKMCGSAMQAVIYAHDSILAGTNDVVVAGGMESMTNAPYLIPKARGGYRIGHGMMYDHMMLDGLEDAYEKGRSMGTFTAASSSSINDGAAALVVMRESTAKKLGCTPLARIVAHTRHSQEPDQFTTAPVGAIAKLYEKTGWNTKEVDLFEVNEAFAAVAMAAMNEHKIPHDKINIHGGACALGHPIGASGARIIVTLLGALKKTGGKRGVAALCIGGGEATAMAIEMM